LHEGSGAAEAGEGLTIDWLGGRFVSDFDDSRREICGEIDVGQSDGGGAYVIDVSDCLGVVCVSLCL
jgi:hypothetical protein